MNGTLSYTNLHGKEYGKHGNTKNKIKSPCSQAVPLEIESRVSKRPMFMPASREGPTQ